MSSIERNFNQYTLGQLFEKDYQTNLPIRFDSSLRHDSTLMYRIPEHQRHPQWKLDKKIKLVDSVLRNYPIGGMILSKVIEDGSEYFNIEDAQTRLTTLDDFYNNKFNLIKADTVLANLDESVVSSIVKFRDLPDFIRRKFENYVINFEIINHANEDDTHEIFERLQEGEPLKNKDKYWNRKDSNFVSYAISITQQPFWNNSYMGTTRAITDTNRNRLPDVCALVSGIILGNNYITPSFNKIGVYLNIDITERYKEDVKEFLLYYNSIIDRVYEENLRGNGEKYRHYYNVAKDLGMILFDWINYPSERSANKQMWVDIINIDRASINFMKGSKTLWNGMRSQDRQNTSSECIRKRVNRIKEFYRDRDTAITTYTIEIN